MKINKEELAEILDVKLVSVRSIESRGQLKDKLREKGYILLGKQKFSRSFTYEVEFDENLIKIEEEYNNLKIKKEKWSNIGVYYILKDNDIYIGSTVDKYITRFRRHKSGKDEHMKHTYELLQNGGEFHILHDMTGIEDEVLVRMVENEYISYFRNYTDYNVINKLDCAYWKLNKIKYKSLQGIKVKEEDYQKAIELLKSNGLIERDNVINTEIYENDFDINNVPF